MIWCVPVCGTVGNYKLKTEDYNYEYWECINCKHIERVKKDV